MKTRYVAKALCACAVLAAALLATPGAAKASPGCVTNSASNPTIDEGNESGLLVFTITNGCALTEDLGPLSIEGPMYSSGDPLDMAEIAYSADSCPGFDTVAASSSCEITYTVTTPPAGSYGSSVYDGTFQVEWGPDPQVYTPLTDFSITTIDLAATPEPSTMLLFGTGLLGMTMMIFRRKKVA